MEDFYLLDYLKDNSELDAETLDILKYELDTRLYYYGNQFKYPFENGSVKKISAFKNILKRLYISSKILKNRNSKSGKVHILSNAYFSVNEELTKAGYEVFCPSWNFTKGGNFLPDLELFFESEKIRKKLILSNFNELISPDFEKRILNLKNNIAFTLKNKGIKAVILCNDMAFFEKILIVVCKEIGIPTFIFLHGLPGRYNDVDDNRTDYLIVWGEKIKQNYIKFGFNADKIFVSGHPYYQKSNQFSPKFSLDNVLVLTKSMNGGQHSDKVRITDRGNSILYLLSIEKVLRKFGVKNVRLRPHPSENIYWYYQFLNQEFFKIDNLSLSDSINDSTIVIGPTSTVFVECLYYGKNYIVYEPVVNNLDLFKFNLVPPFDRSDKRVLIGTNEDELSSIIENEMTIDGSVFNDYVNTTFDLSFIRKLI